MPQPVDHLDLTHLTGHTLSVGAIVTSFFGLVPAIAAIAAFVWYMIQIYESDTIQKWLERHRTITKQRRLTKLKAEQKVIVAEIEALEVVRVARAAATERVAEAQHQATKLLVDQQAHEKNAPLEG